MDTKILILDNDSKTRSTLAAELAEAGRRIHCADSIAKAEALLGFHSIDLVVADIVSYQKGEGSDIFTRLKAFDDALEVIAFTANTSMENVIGMLRNGGAFDYFSKPMQDYSPLRTSVAQALEKRKQKKRNDKLMAGLEAKHHELSEQNRLLRRAQIALSRSDNRFRVISSISSDYFYELTVGENQRLLFEWVGGAFHQITGLQPKDIDCYTNYLNRVHPDDRPAMEKTLKFVLKNNKSTVEYRFVSKEGEQRRLSDTIHPNWDEEKKRVVGIVGAVRDVTKTRLAEQALRESETRREMANMAGQVGVWDWDIINDDFHIDKSIWDALGYMEGAEPVKEELLNKIDGWLRLIHPEDLPSVIHDAEAHIAGQTPHFETTLRMLHKDGGVRWFLARGTAVCDDDGKAVRMLGTETDITGNKEVEDRLRQSEHRYRQLIESSPMPVLMHYNGAIVLLNHMAVYTLGGASANQFLGKQIWDFVHEEDRDPFRRRMKNLLDGVSSADFKEERFINLDGQVIDVSVAGTVVDYEGKTAVQIIFYDITDRKQLEEQVSHSRRMQAVAELAGGIAHELNNALATVLGNVELLQMDSPDPDITDPYLQPIKVSTQRMSNLANQLLAYARGGKYKPKALSVPQFLETTLPVLTRSIDPEMEIQIYIERNVSPIEVDLAQLQMSLFSVIENAHEALADGGSIHIRVGDKQCVPPPTDPTDNVSRGRYVCIEVEDDGQGMDEKTLQRIFDPFFSTKFLGRGLGMAAVYGIVKNHGGWVAVDSVPENGTTVKIFLPALSRGAEGIEAMQTEAPKGSGTLLLIEDETDLLSVSQRLLKRLGYTVLEATTGEEAISSAENYPEDIRLALLDIKLPDMDGHQVYPRLKELRPDMKVIICTGYSIDGPTREILDAGADDFLQKPFTLTQLAEKVKACLGDL